MEVDTFPFESWRTVAEPSGGDIESEEEQPTTTSVHPFGPWRSAIESSNEESEEEPWYTQSKESEEPASELEPVDVEVTQREVGEPSLNLEALNLWDRYQGMSEEQYSAARQQIGGNPLFEFEFSPVSQKQWMKRVQKTIYSTRLKQRREPVDSDDVGVAIVSALEEAAQQHLQKIGARDEDRVFLALTPNGFDHVYQTAAFPVQEFVEGSTRLEELMRKLAGKLNSNQSFHPDQGFQLDLTLVRPMGRGSGREKDLSQT